MLIGANGPKPAGRPTRHHFFLQTNSALTQVKPVSIQWNSGNFPSTFQGCSQNSINSTLLKDLVRADVIYHLSFWTYLYFGVVFWYLKCYYCLHLNSHLLLFDLFILVLAWENYPCNWTARPISSAKRHIEQILTALSQLEAEILPFASVSFVTIATNYFPKYDFKHLSHEPKIFALFPIESHPRGGMTNAGDDMGASGRPCHTTLAVHHCASIPQRPWDVTFCAVAISSSHPMQSHNTRITQNLNSSQEWCTKCNISRSLWDRWIKQLHLEDRSALKRSRSSASRAFDICSSPLGRRGLFLSAAYQ